MPVEHTTRLRCVSSNLGILQEQTESTISSLSCGLFLLALQFSSCSALQFIRDFVFPHSTFAPYSTTILRSTALHEACTFPEEEEEEAKICWNEPLRGVKCPHLWLCLWSSDKVEFKTVVEKLTISEEVCNHISDWEAMLSKISVAKNSESQTAVNFIRGRGRQPKSRLAQFFVKQIIIIIIIIAFIIQGSSFSDRALLF